MSRREIFNTAAALPFAAVAATSFSVPVGAAAAPPAKTPSRLRKIWLHTWKTWQDHDARQGVTDEENNAIASYLMRLERVILRAPLRSEDDAHVKIECMTMIGRYTGAIEGEEIDCLAEVAEFLTGRSMPSRLHA